MCLFKFFFLCLFPLLKADVILGNRFPELNNWAASDKLISEENDVVIFINDVVTDLPQELEPIQTAIADYQKLQTKMVSGIVVPFLIHPKKRIILGLTGNLTVDNADGRLIYNAAKKASEMMILLGLHSPLLVVGPFKTALAAADQPWANGVWPEHIATLGLFHNIYVPLQVREASPETYPSIDRFFVFNPKGLVLHNAQKILIGVFVHRDLCESDQERMTPPKILEYIQEEFKAHTNIKVSSEKITQKAYPMMHAVNRAVQDVKEYDGNVIKIEFTPTGVVEKTHYLIGKGVTFDTGGLSLKTGGGMRWMRADKCGATSVVGFMKALRYFDISSTKVHARLSFVRNGFGSEAYSVDEIIPSAAGVRSLIGSTDAEGRNIMVDLIAEAVKEISSEETPNAHIFTVATLTGHVKSSFGPVSAVLDNGPARKVAMAQNLKKRGDLLADIAQVSSLRLEDYENSYPVTQYEDLQQRNTHPDTITYRGHQYPSAWMLMASKLDNYGLDNPDLQIAYTHIDIHGAVGVSRPDGTATFTPIPMLINTIAPLQET